MNKLVPMLGCAATLALSVTACSDLAPLAKDTGAFSHVLLSDAPFPYDRIARVDIYVVSVSASLDADTSAGAGGFVTLATPHRRINLLALQHGITDELGAVALPTGVITAVRMVIDTDSSSITLKDGRVLTGTSTPGIAWQSSAGRPTLNALIQENIQVPDTGATIVIDYDVGHAFIPPQEIDSTSTDSGFVFSPVLSAVDARRTASISGVVHTSGGAPVAAASLRLYIGDPATPENTWPNLHTAMTDASGAFTFPYVTRSSYWDGTAWAGKKYIVAVDPPSGAGLSRTLVYDVTATAGQETAIGTVTLP
jgi:uncharacterized protein DUF4382